MISKKNKLNKYEFKEVFENGKKIHHPLFTVYIKKHSQSKVSFVVPKKISPKQTERIFIKRRGYLAVKKTELLNKKNQRIIFISKPAIKTSSLEDIIKAIQEIFSS